MRQLRLTTFGGLRFQFGDDCEVRLSTRKTAALMAYLCMHAGRRLTRESLCGLLWSEKSETQARHSLSQALSEARKTFGDDFVQTDGRMIWIDASRVWVDTFELIRLTHEKTVSSLDRAEALYQGDFLAFGELDQERFDEWLLSERERFRQIAQKGLATALALRVGDADAERSLNTARAILALDPFDESAHRVLMQAYAAQGCTPLAVEHYHQLARTLRQELGIAPDPQTMATFQAIEKRSKPQPSQPRTLGQYAFVLEQLPHPVVVTDVQNHIVGWNRLAEDAFGFTKSEIFGRSPTLVYAPDRNPSLADSILKRALRSGRWSKRVNMVSKDGQHRHQQRIVAPLYNPAGELIGAFGHGLIL
jgi:PAS domain S-box-containing protein